MIAGTWCLIEDAKRRPVRDDDVHAIWDSGIKFDAILLRTEAKRAAIQRSRGASPNFQTQDFNAFVDQYGCVRYRFTPGGIGFQEKFMIPRNDNLVPMGEFPEPVIEIEDGGGALAMVGLSERNN